MSQFGLFFSLGGFPNHCGLGSETNRLPRGICLSVSGIVMAEEANAEVRRIGLMVENYSCTTVSRSEVNSTDLLLDMLLLRRVLDRL